MCVWVCVCGCVWCVCMCELCAFVWCACVWVCVDLCVRFFVWLNVGACLILCGFVCGSDVCVVCVWVRVSVDVCSVWECVCDCV